MRIFTNIRRIAPPLTGIGHYSTQLLLQLIDHPQVEEVSAFTGFDSDSGDKLRSKLQGYTQFDGQSSQTHPSWKRRLGALPGSRLLINSLYDLSAKHQVTKGSDVYWDPNFTLLPINLPSVCTIYDLSYYDLPNLHPLERVKELNRKLPATLKRACRIVTISQFSRQRIMEVYGVNPNKIEVISPAVDSLYSSCYSSEQISEIRKKYRLPNSYILSVATLEPRKNLSTLLKVFSTLPKELRKSYPLLLVGAKGWMERELEIIVDQLQQSGELIRLGYVPQVDMPVIYREATLMAYISLYEGYGMPVAEAMVSGTAVLTSNRTSMPEVASGAGCLVNPESEEQIRDSLINLLSDPTLRKEMSARGVACSEAYQWKPRGEQLFNLLHYVASLS